MLQNTTQNLLLFVILCITASCQKDEIAPNIVKDVDGNSYKTVTIGNQVWMAENLRVTMYNDGIMVNNFTDPGSGAGEYRWYEDDEKNSTPYGAFYNYHAVASGKLAPEGWRVATREDYEILKTTLGGNLIAGGKMKLRQPGVWEDPNEIIGEDSGFNAYPAGEFNIHGTFNAKNRIAIWWTSEEHNDTHAHYYRVWHEDTKILWDWSLKTNFYNVRCIKE